MKWIIVLINVFPSSSSGIPHPGIPVSSEWFYTSEECKAAMAEIDYLFPTGTLGCSARGNITYTADGYPSCEGDPDPVGCIKANEVMKKYAPKP